jgi:hypothetical protein
MRSTFLSVSSSSRAAVFCAECCLMLPTVCLPPPNAKPSVSVGKSPRRWLQALGGNDIFSRAVRIAAVAASTTGAHWSGCTGGGTNMPIIRPLQSRIRWHFLRRVSAKRACQRNGMLRARRSNQCSACVSSKCPAGRREGARGGPEAQLSRSTAAS